MSISKIITTYQGIMARISRRRYEMALASREISVCQGSPSTAADDDFILENWHQIEKKLAPKKSFWETATSLGVSSFSPFSLALAASLALLVGAFLFKDTLLQDYSGVKQGQTLPLNIELNLRLGVISTNKDIKPIYKNSAIPLGSTIIFFVEAKSQLPKEGIFVDIDLITPNGMMHSLAKNHLLLSPREAIKIKDEYLGYKPVIAGKYTFLTKQVNSINNARGNNDSSFEIEVVIP